MAQNSEPQGEKRSVLGRAFDILDCFEGAGDEVSVAHIVEKTGLPPATVHRLLSTLLRWGGVERQAHGRYRLSDRVWRLGLGAPAVKRLHEIAQPILVQLHVATQGTVYLAVRDEGFGLFVDRITRIKSTPETMNASRRLPLDQTGGGRVLLAFSPDAQYERHLVTKGAATVAGNRDDLSDILDNIRRTGVAVTHDDVLPGRLSVAAPIFDSEKAIVASVSVTFREEKLNPRAIETALIPNVKQAARAISSEMASLNLLSSDS
ncbi:MAG: helix-turn-helix domain-containing protein [Actinobacteria bacterium]|uniref:Unannotated protein n=1 Tax=freshwater metagenome TaxID=449393 RepID=A0A6J7GJJ1_9ZZZZ|nr:helix-turn-helix domain-containing protein [Actinomycetota bacterium]